MRADSERPNVLVVFSDQQHWQAAGFVDKFFDTPAMDAFSQESVVFDRSFCTTPQCSPSRSSMLTGFYPSRTGVMGNVGAAGGESLNMPTIGWELQQAGYHTGYFGKWHLGDQPIANKGWDTHAHGHDDPATAERAVQFLTQAADGGQPFALFVAINNPHDVYHFSRHQVADDAHAIPLPPSWERETFAGKPPIHKQFMTEDQGKAIEGHPAERWQQYHDCYREKTRLYDQHLGKVIEQMKRLGLWKNTVVIVTSDHGDMDTNHRLIFKGPFMYEHMVRVPLMIRVPKRFGGTGPGRVADVDVVNVDLVPTIRELCGLAEADCHGESLASLLTGRGTYTPREFVVGQYYSKQSWVNPIRMIRTARYKLNRYIGWPNELYDLADDPDELTNRIDDPALAKVKADLIQKLAQWMATHADPFTTFKPTDRAGKPLGEATE